MKILKAKLFILPFGIDGLTSFFFLVWWVYMHQIALKKGQLMSATRLDIVPSTTKILLLVLPVYFSFLRVQSSLCKHYVIRKTPVALISYVRPYLHKCNFIL